MAVAALEYFVPRVQLAAGQAHPYCGVSCVLREACAAAAAVIRLASRTAVAETDHGDLVLQERAAVVRQARDSAGRSAGPAEVVRQEELAVTRARAVPAAAV